MRLLKRPETVDRVAHFVNFNRSKRDEFGHRRIALGNDVTLSSLHPFEQPGKLISCFGSMKQFVELTLRQRMVSPGLIQQKAPESVEHRQSDGTDQGGGQVSDFKPLE